MILFLILHAFYSAAIALVLSLIFGSLSPAVAVLSLLIGMSFGKWQARRLLRAFPEWRFFSFTPSTEGLFEFLLFAFVLYVATRHFIWLFYPVDHTLSTLHAYNFGDLPLHINFIREFAGGVHFPPHNPIFASDLLRYPYGPDMYNALWEVLGVPLSAHLAVTGIVFTIVSLVALRAFGGWWAVGAFFLSGGLAGYEVLRGAGFSDFMQNIDWKNLFISVFITQRGFLFALPAGLLLLVGARRLAEGKSPRFEAVTSLGLLWGILPFFHLHTFFIVSVMIGFIAIENGWQGIRRIFLSRLFFVAFVPATLFLLHSTEGLSRAGVAHWTLGWMSKPGARWSFFWINFGPWLFVPILTMIGLIWSGGAFSEQKRRRLWFDFASNLFLMILFLNFMLAPWDWDNIKILIWPYLGLVRVAYIVLDGRLGVIGRTVAVVTLFFSGFVSLLWSVQKPVERSAAIYQVAELAGAEGALRSVPMQAVFAAAPSHNHMLSYFGRQRAIGYHGHLWSHGVKFEGLAEKVTAIYQGDPRWQELANELGITHIYWGPHERSQYGEGERPWMKVLPNVSGVADHQIYQIVR
jgi:hypothetical protein